jgi:hypothetical protein
MLSKGNIKDSDTRFLNSGVTLLNLLLLYNCYITSNRNMAYNLKS